MNKGEANAHISSDVPRDDPVHLDVLLAPLVAERLGELPKCAFRRGVRGHGDPSLFLSCQRFFFLFFFLSPSKRR